MASLGSPPKTILPQDPPVEGGVPSADLPPDPHLELHLLISELQDENARSRLREALWISIILHLVVLFTIRVAPKYLFHPRPTVVAVSPLSPNEKELTFLQLPKDRQQITKKPDTNKISDKDRIATSKVPRPDRKTLEELRDNRRTGAPGMRAAAPQPATPPPGGPQVAQQQNQSKQATPPQEKSETSVAKLEPPPVMKPSGGAFRIGTAGTAIQQAARAAAASRNSGSYGDYGMGPARPDSNVRSDIDVLSDTQGVDFAPYLQRVLENVRVNWYNLIPEVARPPLLKQGKVAIEFVILPTGQVSGMRLAGPSGDVSLDRAAWGGITASDPFQPLPKEFHGPYLALRFHFYYNPNRNEMR